MTIGYSAKYKDDFGSESVTISNDGKVLKMTLRDVEFTGYSFHSFSISSNIALPEKAMFHLLEDELCGYLIDCRIPVWLVSRNEISQTLLNAQIEYGKPVEGHTSFHRQDGTVQEINQQIDVEVLKLEIEYQGQTYKSSGKNLYNSFDEQLAELRDGFPDGLYLKTCWNCAFSDYHPVGSGIFGDLGCFRNTKSEYKRVKDKRALMLLWSQRADDVQEVHLCQDFEKRQPGEGGFYVG